MTIEVRVPQLPESVADATLVAWHKQPGDAVAPRREPRRPRDRQGRARGAGAGHRHRARARVASGTMVTSGAGAGGHRGGRRPRRSRPRAPARQAAAAARPPRRAGGRRGGREAGKLSPSARRLVEENQLDPQAIPASGRDGRITKSDVVGFLGRKPAEAPAAAAAPAAARRARRPPGRRRPPARTEQRVPMTRLRARIAPAAGRGAVHPGAAHHLQRGRPDGGEGAARALQGALREGARRASSASCRSSSRRRSRRCKRFPVVNASVDGNDIVYHDYYDIGVAVSTDRGLIVPVLRDADVMSFADDREGRSATTRARRATARSRIEDLTGGTFIDHQRRRVRLAACRRRSSTRRRARSSACTRSRSARWWSTGRSWCGR